MPSVDRLWKKTVAKLAARARADQKYSKHESKRQQLEHDSNFDQKFSSIF